MKLYAICYKGRKPLKEKLVFDHINFEGLDKQGERREQREQGKKKLYVFRVYPAELMWSSTSGLSY